MHLDLDSSEKQPRQSFETFSFAMFERILEVDI